MAGAIFYSVSAAQEPRDTLAVPRDTAPPPVDTIQTRPDTVVRRDTVKAPLARAELPKTVDDRDRYHWTREELFVGGGLTLLELLERIPGATGFRSGWVAAPAHATWLGGAGRVRIFYDGFEIEPFDDRTGGLVELGEIQLWTLEEVLVEPGADELRVYLRSWRVDRTTTASRTDIFTGDDDTNYYRGFLGRRFSHGEALQAGFQQYGTIGPTGSGGDELSLIARVGWATRHVSIDGFGIRARRQRNLQIREDTYEIPQLNSIRRDAYARIAVGDPDRGGWAQVVFAGQDFTRERTEADTIEEKLARNQLVGALGWSTNAVRASLTSRTFGGDEGPQSVTGRVSLASRVAALGFLAEWRDGDSTSVGEVSARVSPFSFLTLSGTASLRRPPSEADGEDVRSLRGEVGLRIGQLWFTGGGVILDSMHVPPPAIFDSTFIANDEGRSRALFGGVSGRIWRAIHADVFAFSWERQGFYRPQLQVRSELFVRTRWLKKFPSGNFGALLSVRHDYRDGISFPREETGPLVAPASHEIHSLVEVRIVDAILFWRQRYTVGQQTTEFVPGYSVPRQTTLYGVRWDFWN